MGGETHLRYDLFGEAVDTAERMARAAKLESIQVDQRTFTILNMAHLKENYKFTLRTLGSMHSFLPDVQDLGVRVILIEAEEIQPVGGDAGSSENGPEQEVDVRPAAAASSGLSASGS